MSEIESKFSVQKKGKITEAMDAIDRGAQISLRRWEEQQAKNEENVFDFQFGSP